MNTLRVSLLCSLVAVAFSLVSPVAAAADAECLPKINDGWIRVPPANIPVLAGFGAIANPCDTGMTVVSGSSPGFDDVSIHETRFEDGIAKMRAIPKLTVPAGESVTLKPGGLHMMLMKPKRTPVAGDVIRIDFKLDDGRTVSGDFEIRK
ncbi:copper chaperone PCu(A)C [Lysobacter sp. A03]|uniref:copper chaperone PCu(A)C n=1 Tax=Lysobacter sp. A03 TaxID=1199154 RepID=UPI0005B6C068|nr:copper chaperone PCu(A)C [Lysobacter sp. A03]KIQ98123.1 Copper metallochaperone Cox17-like protein [Lysobacter sp. A03]